MLPRPTHDFYDLSRGILPRDLGTLQTNFTEGDLRPSQGRVQIDGFRNVYAITVATRRKVQLDKGTRVRTVGHMGHDTTIVEPDDSLTGGHRAELTAFPAIGRKFAA